MFCGYGFRFFFSIGSRLGVVSVVSSLWLFLVLVC